MDYKVFFGSGFNGKQVYFEDTLSTWTLGKKILERRVQGDVTEYTNLHAASVAWAIYECENAEVPGEEAIMKIYMQIPYAGSEFDTPDDRQSQAVAPRGFAASELNSLKTLTARGCSATPKLLDYKHENQGQGSLVPGGFVLHLLMEKLPGRRLGLEFWYLDETERRSIRQAFKDAWTECHKNGIVLSLGNIDNIIWDSHQQKVYFTGFQDGDPSDPHDTWSDKVMFTWALLSPPLSLPSQLPTG